MGNKQSGFAIHYRPKVILEGKEITDEPYDTRVSSKILRESSGESPLRYLIGGSFYFIQTSICPLFTLSPLTNFNFKLIENFF